MRSFHSCGVFRSASVLQSNKSFCFFRTCAPSHKGLCVKQEVVILRYQISNILAPHSQGSRINVIQVCRGFRAAISIHSGLILHCRLKPFSRLVKWKPHRITPIWCLHPLYQYRLTFYISDSRVAFLSFLKRGILGYFICVWFYISLTSRHFFFYVFILTSSLNCYQQDSCFDKFSKS